MKLTKLFTTFARRTNNWVEKHSATAKKIMSRIIFSILISIILIGCTSTKTIKVVDDKGIPVEGALVISEEYPYIWQSWKLGIYVTNKKGEAKVVHYRGYIFKPGFFPVINSSELNDEILWTPFSYFSRETPIYPIKSTENISIDITTFVTESPIANGVFEIPINACASTHVTYNVDDSLLKVTSENKNIIMSHRFHFVGPADTGKVSEAESKNNIAFYCKDNNELFKVGVSVSAKVWHLGISAHKLIIFTAKIPSLETYLQPDVKCASPKHAEFGTMHKYRDGKPNFYMSADIINKLNYFKKDVPCANKNTDKIFDYLKQYLKNNFSQ